MSAQSYLQLNKYTLQNKYSDKLIELSNQLYIKNKFLVDCGIDKTECLHTFLMYNLLNNCGCEIKNYIEDKIKLDTTCKKSLPKLLQEYKKKCPEEDICQVTQCLVMDDEW